MQVTLDNVWTSPSTLHGRVTVWGPNMTWRHRYDVAVPLDEIPLEAMVGLRDRLLDREPSEPSLDVPLF